LVATVGWRDTCPGEGSAGVCTCAVAPVRWTRSVAPVNDRAGDGVLRSASRGGGYLERRRPTAGRNRKRAAWRRIRGGINHDRFRSSGGGEPDVVGYGQFNGKCSGSGVRVRRVG